ncbi:MAG: hypothetical protein PHR18_06580 [Oscillospiraceae bacterium]|nr:hypothetical protein [Oscillospiraceae bacterium]
MLVEVSGADVDPEATVSADGGANPDADAEEAEAAEKIEARRSKKGFLRGKIIEVLKTGSERIAPVCDVFAQCGGCQLQHVNYATQL